MQAELGRYTGNHGCSAKQNKAETGYVSLGVREGSNVFLSETIEIAGSNGLFYMCSMHFLGNDRFYGGMLFSRNVFRTIENIAVCIYTTPGALRAPGLVYIESVVFSSSLHIYTTKLSTPAISLFFLSPNPVVVYIFGVPNRWHSFSCFSVADYNYMLRQIRHLQPSTKPRASSQNSTKKQCVSFSMPFENMRSP